MINNNDGNRKKKKTHQNEMITVESLKKIDWKSETIQDWRLIGSQYSSLCYVIIKPNENRSAVRSIQLPALNAQTRRAQWNLVSAVAIVLNL